MGVLVSLASSCSLVVSQVTKKVSCGEGDPLWLTVDFVAIESVKVNTCETTASSSMHFRSIAVRIPASMPHSPAGIES